MWWMWRGRRRRRGRRVGGGGGGGGSGGAKGKRKPILSKNKGARNNASMAEVIAIAAKRICGKTILILCQQYQRTCRFDKWAFVSW